MHNVVGKYIHVHCYITQSVHARAAYYIAMMTAFES